MSAESICVVFRCYTKSIFVELSMLHAASMKRFHTVTLCIIFITRSTHSVMESYQELMNKSHTNVNIQLSPYPIPVK